MMRRFLKIFILILFAVQVGTARGQTHWESLLLESDIFKYTVTETALTADWIQRDYDDDSWSAAPGGFGYQDGDDRTVIPSTTMLYLRKTLTLPPSVPVHELILDIDYDDAFIACINGVEVARSPNLPAGVPGLPENVTYDHEAVMYTGGLPERFRLDPQLLTEGENILAFQILNISLTSSDMSARIFLHAEIESEQFLFHDPPGWFTEPVSYGTTNLPIIKINTWGQTIPDEPKIMAWMQVINNPGGINHFSDTTYEYNGDIGIEIRGNTAQMFPKKSYTVETRLSTGENNNVSLLGLPVENDWVLHGPYSDKSLMRNALAYAIGNSMGDRWHPRTRFVELELNGEYNGVYLFVEKIKIDKHRVDIADLRPEDVAGDQLTGGYIISIDRDQEGSWNSPFMGRTGSVDVPFSYVDPKYDELTVEQRNYIREYITDFEYALDGDNYKDPQVGYRAYIDIVSFIDYFIITELSRDLDGYRVSVFFHKDKDSKGGRLTMTPFWDYNICFGNANFMQAWDPVGWASDGIGAGDWYEIPFWWDKFRTDPYFETLLKIRWEALRENQISKATLNQFIDSCSNLLAEAQVRNFEKWNVLNSYVWPNYYIGGTYPNEVNYLRNWISDRIDWLDAQIATIVPLNLRIPSVTTVKAYNITETTAVIGGNITDDGGSTISERGIYWDTVPNTLDNGKKVRIGSGLGYYTMQLSGLSPDREVYVRAYAINDLGIAYGEELSFRTKEYQTLPQIFTIQASEITDSSALVGGYVLSTDGTAVTERGIYYGTEPLPEVNGTKVQVGTGEGQFSARLDDLFANTIYYVKAYAANAAGTAFGAQDSFSTKETLTSLNGRSVPGSVRTMVYPNPSAGSMTFVFNTETEGDAKVIIRNLIGETIGIHSLVCLPGPNRFILSSDDFPPGGNIFFYTLIIDEIPVAAGKLIRQ
ncbi:MAG: CotH kinase family protein [Bacteroidales bacterium]|nr:CotH kinase family protein [Bacteroidales bacterium]